MFRFSTFRTSLRLVAVAALVLSSTAASAWHLSLTDSFPKADQVLTESPDSIRLWFNQEPELALAAISLEGENGALEMGQPRETNDPKSFKAAVLGKLASGSYRVTWRAAGSDGHAVRGRYDFEVRSGTQLSVPGQR